MPGHHEENFAGEYEFVPYRESEDDAYDRWAQAQLDAKENVEKVPPMTLAEYREHLASQAKKRIEAAFEEAACRSGVDRGEAD